MLASPAGYRSGRFGRPDLACPLSEQGLGYIEEACHVGLEGLHSRKPVTWQSCERSRKSISVNSGLVSLFSSVGPQVCGGRFSSYYKEKDNRNSKRGT